MSGFPFPRPTKTRDEQLRERAHALYLDPPGASPTTRLLVRLAAIAVEYDIETKGTADATELDAQVDAALVEQREADERQAQLDGEQRARRRRAQLEGLAVLCAQGHITVQQLVEQTRQIRESA